MPQRYIRMDDQWALIEDSTPRKIIYSPGFGAGWVSWAGGPKEYQLFLLTHPELIEYIETGGDFPNYLQLSVDLEKIRNSHPKLHRILTDICNHCEKVWGTTPYLGGLNNAQVAVVHGEIQIDEYDGSERIISREEDDRWL